MEGSQWVRVAIVSVPFFRVLLHLKGVLLTLSYGAMQWMRGRREGRRKREAAKAE